MNTFDEQIDEVWAQVCASEQLSAYGSAYALHAPHYRDIWSTRTLVACKFAMTDIHSTLASWPDQTAYTGRLWAELDAIRDRMMAIDKGN